MVEELIKEFPGVIRVSMAPEIHGPDADALQKAIVPSLPGRGETFGPFPLPPRGFGQVVLPLYQSPGSVGAINVWIQEKQGVLPLSNRQLDTLMLLARQVAGVLARLRAQEEIRNKEKLAAVGELAAGLAHEIRNPLGAIKGAAQYLNPGIGPEEARAFLGVIREEVDRLNRVVGQFLDYARPFKKNLTSIAPDALLQKVVAVGRKTLPSDIDLRTDLNLPLPNLTVDPDQIKQVVDNLILNAVEAMPQGGRITVEARKWKQDQIEIAVRDTGSGIPPGNLPRLFQPFFTTKTHGTGLGLAICHRIIAGHGGTIGVDPSEGGGSRFRIRLPLSEVPPKEDTNR